MNAFKSFAVATGLFTATLLQAQSTTNVTAPAVNDPAAKAILDELSKTVKAYTSVKADFSMSNKAKSGTTDSYEGSLQLKGKKYKVTFKGDESINDGATSWNYSKSSNEVTVDDATAKPGKMTPDQLFTFYEKDFKYKYIKEEVQSGTTVQIIDVYPVKPDGKNYHTVRLTIDKAKKQLKSAEFKNKDGSTSTYMVKNFVANGTMDDTVFSFDKKAHPGVKEVNLKEDE